MIFAGWAGLDLALLFGVGSAAITGLYLLRMRRRRIEVPFAGLWNRVTQESEARRLWRRLRKLASWFLQIIILGLTCLTLGDPRPEVWLRPAKTLAIIVDTSASMAADSEPGETRLQVAVARARAELDALGPQDQAVLIAAGTEITVLEPLGSPLSSLLTALAPLRSAPGDSDLEGAIALAGDLIADQVGAEILILSDGASPQSASGPLHTCLTKNTDTPTDPKRATAGPPCRILLIEGSTRNVAITAFAARRYPHDRAKVQVLVEVRNLGDAPANFILNLSSDGTPVSAPHMIDLQAGETRSILVDRVDSIHRRLLASLESSPGEENTESVLGPPHDDFAWAVVPPLDPLRVTLVTDGTNLFLEAALLVLDDHIHLTTVPVSEGSATNAAVHNAAVVFYDLGPNPLPNPLPDTDLVLFDPYRAQNSLAPIALDNNLKQPRITEQDRRHPILRGVVFKDVNMARGTSFKTRPSDHALVSHLGEALVVLRESAHSTLAIGFDPRQSDLPMRVAFPVLIANIIDYFSGREAGFVASVQVGLSRELTLADLGLDGRNAQSVRIRPPSAESIAKMPNVMDRDSAALQTARLYEGRFRLRATVPGIYEIEVIGGPEDGRRVEVAVNIASSEASDLRSRVRVEDIPLHARAGESPPPSPLDRGPLWSLLLLVAAALVTIEWTTYHRRKTV